MAYEKQKVQGVGGIFFRAENPEGLARWYEEHLGINPAPTDMEMAPWKTESGVTVFSPFAADTDYFAADKTFMLNFRVADLGMMITQLRSAGIKVSHESEMEGIGRFARIHDPKATHLCGHCRRDVNGAKIWSSYAYFSDYAVCLARTDWDVPKH